MQGLWFATILGLGGLVVGATLSCGGTTERTGSSGSAGSSAGAGSGGLGGGGTTGTGGTADAASGCNYKGLKLNPGDKLSDPCNQCECTEEGLFCTQKACVTCDYAGETHYAGDKFPAPDGCNECSCLEDGTVACTERGCDLCYHGNRGYQPGQTFTTDDGCRICTCQTGGALRCMETGTCASTCVYNGISYKPGDSFPSVDGCNTCTCREAGAVSCTTIACPCDRATEWHRKYVGGSAQECAAIRFACPENTRYFSNLCGCGCQQSETCPRSYNCAPPAMCNVDEIRRQCPYSEIFF